MDLTRVWMLIVICVVIVFLICGVVMTKKGPNEPEKFDDIP